MRIILTLVLLASTAAAQVETVPPPPAPPRSFVTPPVIERTLRNGLRVIVAERKHAPFCSVRLVFRSGAADDPADRAGLASAAFRTVGKDTYMASEIEALGASFGRATLHDSSLIEIDRLQPGDLSAALSHVAKAIESSAFDRDDEKDDEILDDVLAREKDDLRMVMSEAERIAIFVAPHVVFQNAYAHNIAGSLRSLDRIGSDDVASFRAAHLRPDNAILVMTGNIRPRRAFAIAKKVFGKWQGDWWETLERTEIEESPAARRIVVIDMPTAPEAAVVIGRPALRRADPAHAIAVVADAILGDGSSSRLYQEIRVRRGLSYAPSASVDPRRGAGPFYATVQTTNERAPEVAGVILDELEKLGSTLANDAELQPRKAAAVGQFLRSMETTAALADHLSLLAMHGIPLEELARRIERISRVTAEDVQSYAAKHLGATDASIIIVGDAKQFLPVMQERFADEITVVPVEELDLDSCCE
jgi:zinc protease